MDRVTEAALVNPVINAAHVEEARRKAWGEVTVLLQCLEELSTDDPEYSAIQRDIMRIVNLPGMTSNE